MRNNIFVTFVPRLSVEAHISRTQMHNTSLFSTLNLPSSNRVPKPTMAATSAPFWSNFVHQCTNSNRTLSPDGSNTALTRHTKLSSLCTHFNALIDTHTDLAAHYRVLPSSLLECDQILPEVKNFLVSCFETSRLTDLFGQIVFTIELAEQDLSEGRIGAVEVDVRSLEKMTKEVKDTEACAWWCLRICEMVEGGRRCECCGILIKEKT